MKLFRIGSRPDRDVKARDRDVGLTSRDDRGRDETFVALLISRRDLDVRVTVGPTRCNILSSISVLI